jgi:hypothetical protein
VVRCPALCSSFLSFLLPVRDGSCLYTKCFNEMLVSSFVIPDCVKFLAGDSFIVLESSDQKTRGFVVQFALPRWFSERVHQVFDEMPVRT